MTTFTCEHCPATYTISSDVLIPSQAAFFVQLRGWKLFVIEGADRPSVWCPACRWKYEPRPPAPPPRKTPMAKLREQRRPFVPRPTQ